MADVDVRRTVPARLVEDIDAEGQCEPGCVQHIANGYFMACPGCAMQMVLPVGGSRGWTVTAGDWTDPTTLSLQPSIYHPATGTPKGCGWHGYLTGGVFRSL